MKTVSFTNKDQTKYGMLMLATAIFAVTAVGVSTAQVMNTLSVKPSSSILLESAAEYVADFSVTLGDVPDSEKRLLVLENVQDRELTIHHLDSNAFLHKGSFGDEHSGSITLKPSQKVSVLIDGPVFSERSVGNRLVSMKGRLLDGHLVLFSN